MLDGMQGFGAAALVVALACTACGATPRGATAENLGKARQTLGAVVYARECASCHGERGEGLASTPAVMGPGALPTYARDPSTLSSTTLQTVAADERAKSVPMGADWRGTFKTAADLFEYVSKQMPRPRSRSGSLSGEDYWAVVNFMLLGHGVRVPPGGVTAQNAASVALR